MHAIFHRRAAALLQPFLQRGFVVAALDSLRVSRSGRANEGALQKRGGWRQAGIEINRAENCFENIRKQPSFVAASCFFFARAQAQMRAEREAFGGGVQRGGADQTREPLGKLARIPIRKRLAKMFADDQTEYAV